MSIKKILLILITIIAIFIIAVFAVVYLSGERDKTISVVDKGEPAIEQEREQEQKAEEKPLTEEEIEQEVKSEEELLGQIIESGKIEDCDRLSDKYKTICANNVLLEQAKKNLDKSICDKTVGEDFKNICQIQVEREIEKQELEANKSEKEEIKEKFKSSVLYKEMVKYRDQGEPIPDQVLVRYLELVYDHKDPENCKELPDYKIQDCINKVYLHLARNNNDLEGCELIKDNFWKDICIRDIIIRRAHNEMNPELCQFLLGNAKNECLEGL